MPQRSKTIGPKKLKPGPRRKDLKKKHRPRVRLSRHKQRSVWFQSCSAWPMREAPVHALVRERNRTQQTLPATENVVWECIGPTNIGGRMTSIVCHPERPNCIWAGAAAGGVWHSKDAGRTWRALWRDHETLNIGSLAIDPKNPAVIYCGTGEANLSVDSYAGVGIYRTDNGGKTWKLVASSDETGVPTRIGVIAIDPFDSKYLRIGGVGANESSARPKDLGGMFASDDGGATWKRETFVSRNNYWCHAIVFHPAKRRVIFATFTEQGAKSGIWRSADGGENWMQLTEGLPDPECFGRTSLAISLSNPDVMYAFAEDAHSYRSDLLLGVFRSDDGGKSWREIGGKHFSGEEQISYGNTIAVHPKNPDHVLCGGVDLHLTTNGGKRWKKVTRWDAKPGDADYAHSDHHHLLMPPGAPGRVYDTNDGGLDVSRDGGITWSNRSKGLAITMYYDLDVAQSDSRHFGGGAQDNGTVATTTGRANDHFEILGGDGGWMIYDPAEAGHIFASYYNMNIWRWCNGRRWDVSPPAPEKEKDSVWMVYVTMAPGDAKTVFTGSKRVWRTKNAGKTWKAVSPVLDDSAISAIEVAPSDSNRIYVGTKNGGFFRSVDEGKTWSANLTGATLPGHEITRIDSTAGLGSDFVLITLANFGHSHLFRSPDGGKTWEDIDKGRLPDVPHHAVVIRPDAPRTVYVANDAGVFVSRNSGRSWMNMSANLPNVNVVDLVFHEKDRTLSAATYGRSLWRTKID
ncbi:MAG: hypothetical protein DME61_01725 [Verrucomicrobia bacterium]|nr:MAG: hypothetical protein DME61_01725 [Verrucomicrobiota bacterium]